MATATIFRGFTRPIENQCLIQITKAITIGKYKVPVEEIRSLISQGKTVEADNLKKKLDAFTPSGIFEGGRKMEFLKMYSGYIILDYDKLSDEQLTAAFETASAIEYTFCCFRSPGGKGLKILVEVDSGVEQHDYAYKCLSEYYSSMMNLTVDSSGKDITRLCYFSYDPDAYRNIYSVKFPVVITAEAVEKEEVPGVGIVSTEDNPFEAILEKQLVFTNNKQQFIERNRNNYVFCFTMNCNRVGIPEDHTLDFCLKRLNYDEKEIRTTVQNGYKNHKEEFAKFAKFAGLQKEGTKKEEGDAETVIEDYLKNTPFIPDDIFPALATIISDGANVFADKRERDVFLTAALAILSGCLPGVKGLYNRQEVFPNLFAFIVAPAASGKGTLKFAKMLGDEYHRASVKMSKQMAEEFQIAKEEKKGKKGNEGTEGDSGERLEKPPFKIVFIPANCSYAKLLVHLEENSGCGIICETEADTLSNVFKQDWGSYSDLLRKAFHHEKVSSSKKNNNEFIEVDNPKLSIALSGTPNQVTGLIASAEDGLFSRFIYYEFRSDQIWRDVSPEGSRMNLTEYFRALSKKVYEMVLFFEDKETEIELTIGQWKLLNDNCTDWLQKTVTFSNEEAGSVVKRIGLIMYRIAMIFTAIRKFENGDLSRVVQCTDCDFAIALKLSEVYLNHSILMFNNLPKQEAGPMFNKTDYKRTFFDSLPVDFTRADALAAGEKHTMKIRTVDEFLRDAVNNSLLTRPKLGSYKKV